MVIISVVVAVDLIVVVAVVVVIVVIVAPVVTVTVDVIGNLYLKHVLSARSFDKHPISQYFIYLDEI